MIKKKCGVCGSDFDPSINKLCHTCGSYNRINFELAFALSLFFILPSAAIVKGTGNFLYLLTGLIGLAIYVFNIRFVRDKEKTFGVLLRAKEYNNDFEALKANGMGPLNFLYNHGDEISGLRKLEKWSELRTLVFKNDMMAVPLENEDQVKQIDILLGFEDVMSCLEKENERMMLFIDKCQRYNKDLISDLDRKGIYSISPFD